MNQNEARKLNLLSPPRSQPLAFQFEFLTVSGDVEHVKVTVAQQWRLDVELSEVHSDLTKSFTKMLIKLSTARALIKEKKKDIFPRTFLDFKKKVDSGLWTSLDFFQKKI